MSDKVYSENDLLMHKAEAVRYERQRCAQAASAAVMKFRSKVGGKYYPGYHEDLRDAVKVAVLAGPDASKAKQVEKDQ